jgi:hypothetical protein
MTIRLPLLFAVAFAAAASLTALGSPPGTGSGSMTVAGKNAKIVSSAAFVDASDEKKPLVLVLADRPLPAAGWKKVSEFSAWSHQNAFIGVAFHLDKDNAVYRCDVFDGTDFPTSASGLFDLKVERKAGAVSGSVKSNAAAAKLRHPIGLDATFRADLK